MLDGYVTNDDGVCCAKLCFAVDSEGNQCTAGGPSSGDDSPIGFVTIVLGSLTMVVLG